MIKLMKSTFYHEQEIKDKLCDFIQHSEQLSMGSKCAEYEKAFAEWQGRKYAVMYNSGSSANLALIQSLLNIDKLKKGDEVGFSNITWATNVMPLIQLGLKPLPIDVSLKTLNVHEDNLHHFYLNDTKALFITHLLGFSGDIDKIKNYCRDNKILLLEDTCEAFGSEVNGTKLGNFGYASTFSTFVGHHLSTIEGGMVCTDDYDLYNMLKMVRTHGWDRNLDKPKQISLRLKNGVDDFFSKYTFYDVAYNLRPTEIQGFLGLEQLIYADEIINKRVENFKYLNDIAKENKSLIKLDLSHMNKISNFAYPVIRMQDLEAYKKVFSDIAEIRPLVGGCMTQQPFFKKYVSKKYACPNAAFLNKNGFYFANNPELTKEELTSLGGLLKQ